VERVWVWRQPDGPVPEALVAAVAGLGVGCADVVARLLWNRDVSDPKDAEAFLRPTLARGLRSPLLLADMQRAVRRLADALAARETIAVYADYDVDGVSGAAQLVSFFRDLGSPPLVHVSHRAREGYGLHSDVLRQLRDAGARVVVTADCGTANVAELRIATELGLDVIVCDHHHAPLERPPAYAVLNPLRADCSFPFKGLSGAGVVFYLLMGLRTELRARGVAAVPDLRRYLDFVALGTVADVVPLRDENRVLVAHGLRALEHTERPGLRALKESALVERASVRAIGFRLAPRLNASGRLADAGVAVEVLTTESSERARELVAELEMRNAERRTVEDVMVREARRLVDAEDATAGAGIVVASDTWHAGVVGIVAARLVAAYRRPALVIALEGDEGRGSGRSVGGFHLLDALGECEQLLERFGGHRQAVGFSVRREHVPALRSLFAASVRRRLAPDDIRPTLAIDAELSLAAVTTELAAGLALLEPHGPGNPEPALLARGVRVEGARPVGDPSRPHMKLRLRADGRTIPAIAFGMGHDRVSAGDRVDVVFTPRLTRWQDVERLELEVVGWRQSQAIEGAQGADIEREYCIP
jgi:single-stranded-DNA-specific exonuclease